MKPEDDPKILVIPDGATGNLDEWLASLPRDEPPLDLGMSAAELIAEVRRESG
jgi:hypothetical protein